MGLSKRTALEWLYRLAKTNLWLGHWTLSDVEIDRHFVPSSQVATIGHDSDRSVLQIEYYNGLLFQAEAVPYAIFEALMSVKDFDNAMLTFIRDHKFYRIGVLPPVYLG